MLSQRFSKRDQRKLWANWSDLTADPASCRRLDHRSPEVVSDMDDSAILGGSVY